MENNNDLIRRLAESIKKQVSAEQDKGINKPRSTIRHLESAGDGSTVRLLTSLPVFSQKAT